VFYMITFMLFLGFTYRKMSEPKENETDENVKSIKPPIKFNKKGK
jgi:hypothetical protein